MRIHQKHVLMCTGPRCTKEGVQAETLFKKLGQLIDARDELQVKRTRTHCFAICENGPIMVVYPDGVWYHKLDETSLERIVSEHLQADCPVESHIFHHIGEGEIVQDKLP